MMLKLVCSDFMLFYVFDITHCELFYHTQTVGSLINSNLYQNCRFITVVPNRDAHKNAWIANLNNVTKVNNLIHENGFTDTKTV